MKKIISIVLGVLTLCSAVFAQNELKVKFGQIEGTEDFIKAVENNPTLEYWGNKIVSRSK